MTDFKINRTENGAVVFVDSSGRKHYYSQSMRLSLKRRLDAISKDEGVSLADLSIKIGKSRTYLSNIAGESAFSANGDISKGQKTRLLSKVEEVLFLREAPKFEQKKPILLSKDDIANELKRTLGYNTALWVDGHLVLSNK